MVYIILTAPVAYPADPIESLLLTDNLLTLQSRLRFIPVFRFPFAPTPVHKIFSPCFAILFLSFFYKHCYYERGIVMNEFLKYLKMIPVIIYPYIYVLILAVFFLFVGVLPEDTTDISLLVLLIIAVIYNLYSFVIVIVNAVQTAKGKLTAGQAARMNLIIKGIQIPAYIMHFILGFIGLAMSVWGIGFLLWAVLIDLLTILLTGISSIGCSIRMRKERLVSLPGAIFMGIGCFIYCADVVIAIVYVVKARKKSPAK